MVSDKKRTREKSEGVEKDTFDHAAERLRETRVRILASLKYWKTKLALDHWDFDLEFHLLKDDENPGTVARVYVLHEYQTASVVFYLPPASELSEDELDYAVVHELTHCHINNLMPSGKKWTPEQRKDLERAVVNMAKALIRTKYDKSAEIPGKTT